MIVAENIEGYEAFKTFVAGLSENDKVVFYFGGSKLSNGQSWCIDCVRAAPVQAEVLKNLQSDVRFVDVCVGDRAFWKDMNCPFRTDPSLRLLMLPTYIRWNTVRRLEGDHCNNKDLVELLFAEEED